MNKAKLEILKIVSNVTGNNPQKYIDRTAIDRRISWDNREIILTGKLTDLIDELVAEGLLASEPGTRWNVAMTPKGIEQLTVNS